MKIILKSKNIDDFRYIYPIVEERKDFKLPTI